MTRPAVLLLGGHGFIGSALAKRLRLDGRQVCVIGRRDIDQLEATLPLCGTVLHLASTTTPGASATQSGLELENLQLTLRLMDLLRRQADTHLVFFSSGGTVYGNPVALPVSEDAALAPLSNHGAGKVAQEAFCHALRANGNPVSILRPSNAYGPGQSLKSGFGLVRTLLEHARRGTVLEIWGDGENVRDYIYIDDVVEATVRLIRHPECAGVYNLGCGVGQTVTEVRALVEQVSGLPVQTLHHAARGIDVRSVVLSCQRAQSRLGWQPATGLAQGIANSWRWLQQK